MKKNHNEKAFAPIAAVLSVLTLFVFACCAFLVASNLKPDFRDSVKENVNSFLYKENTQEEENTENTSARLMCAGNNMIYRSIYSYAASLGRETGSEYDFSPIYRNIGSIISKADIAMINQSTVISQNLPVSTYPNFCSPVQVGDAIYDMGFTVINHANSNVFDKNEQGAADTLSYWATKENALVTGLYENEENAANIRYKEVNGIKIGFLSVTDSINGTVASDSDLYVINLGDRDHTKAEVYNTLRDMIKTAKETVDAVVVSVCFANSSSSEITDSQRQTIDYLVSFGADVIFGFGIDTVQPVERIERDDSTSAVVYYSLGNLLSAEEKKENMLGAIADVVFEKDGKTGQTIVKSAAAIPIVTYYERNYTNFNILPAESITEDALASHALNTYYGGFNASYVSQTFSEILKPVPDADFSSETATDAESTSDR